MTDLITCSCGTRYKITLTSEPGLATTLVTCDCLEVMRLRGRIQYMETEDGIGIWRQAEVLMKACA
jgi:hypothetical protein